MHPFEALTELGLPRDADAGSVRAAYLRLLRERRPETDPDGFMRLREAYELVRHRPAPGFDLPPFVPRPAVPEVEAAEVAVEAPAESEVPDQPEPEPERYVEEEVDDASDAEPTAEPEDWLAAWERAAQTGGEPPFPAFVALYRTLQLYEAENPGTARRLGSALDQWLHVRLDETRYFHGEGALTLRNLRQLLLLPPDYPVVELRLLAEAIRRGDPSHARWDLKDVLEIRESSSRARVLLAEHAPRLSEEVFRVEEPVPSPVQEETSFRSWYLVIFVGMALLRVCANLGE